MGRIAKAYRERIVRALAASTTGSERAAVANEWSQLCGVSLQAIYNLAKANGVSSGRSTRRDAGSRKLDITDDQLQRVASLILGSHTDKYGPRLPADSAIGIAERLGWLPAGHGLTSAYLNAWMARRHISKADATALTPHTRMQSLYANHVHQVDASVLAQWFLEDDDSLVHLREGADKWSNKPTKKRPIVRWLIVDHLSGALFVWYTHTETTLDLLEFLYLAWSDKTLAASRIADQLGDDTARLAQSYIFHGAPKLLYTDNGSALRSEILRNVLAKLSIEVDYHKPGVPRAKGANERMQDVWETYFETELKHMPARNLPELNGRAFRAAAALNANRPHSRHGATRNEKWHQRVQGNLRQLPDYHILRSLATASPETRQVKTDGTFSFKTRIRCAEEHSGVYFVGRERSHLWGGKVEVEYSLYDYPAVIAIARPSGERFVCHPQIVNADGFIESISAVWGESFKSAPLTPAERALNEIHAPGAQGTRRLQHQTGTGILSGEPIHIPPASPDSLPTFAPLSSTPVIPITDEKEAVDDHERMRSKVLNELRVTWRDLAPQQRAILEAMPDKVPVNDLHKIAAQVIAAAPEPPSIHSIGG